ncbi:MAG: acetate/propionate family kinase [Pseudomonadota bacterium]
MTQCLIVINSGSTSLKFAIYRPNKINAAPASLYSGAINNMQSAPNFIVKDHEGKQIHSHVWDNGIVLNCADALHFALEWLAEKMPHLSIIAAGHRIVLGGRRFTQPTLIDDEILDYLDSLSQMEPSHQPANVGGIKIVAKHFPQVPQVACFDSAFHRSMPAVAQTYALPKEVLELGVRHWGYHGISYDYISRKLKKLMPHAHRVIVAHLGGGCSLCAMLDGKSIETTMGFSGLSGLPMATRSGNLPPEIIFYLLRMHKYTVESVEKLLYQRSGLLGLSGETHDMQTLLQSQSAAAKRTLEYFVYHIVQYVGAYMTLLGGLDALVFTAGIGENAAEIRQQVCQRLAFLGIELDAKKNAKHGPCISTIASKVAVWVVPTNEEEMVAMYTKEILQEKNLLTF